ncbi:MAG: aldehyde dehydrogenase family protein [Verrucomicrobia bacterium]|nr:aldehyde dehydrogenase family protein [Verrucomicrobiota bacterium]MBV9645403.1 aldehyde dehydrogenase family protein [Verrucomicrobiota bacterium]
MSSVRQIFETMEYGPAPEQTDLALNWLEEHGYAMQPFIYGEFARFMDESYFESINPRDGKPLARLVQCGQTEVNAAVAAANAAFPAWSALSGHERARYLYAIARQIQKHSRLFAVLESLDNGKPIRESRDIDIPLVARHFYHHAGWAQLRSETYIGYEPIGVCGQIIPWNFPLLMLAWKVAPALAAGNTLVLKPAEFTSLTALLFAEVLQQISLPPGVVNIVTGDGQTGELIVRHKDVRKIAFTGSTEVGRIIRRETAGTGKKLSLELGGKSPFIVFEDADLDAAVEGVVDAIWFNQGQVCCAGSRLLLQEGIAEKVIEKLRRRMETLRVGDPLDKGIDIGAIVAPVQLQRIQQLVEQGKAEGATCWQPTWALPEEGFFYPPTLFTGVEPASTLAQIEIFGPVLVTMTFRTPGESVELANNTPYGLAASVWTENLNLALDIAPKLKAGVVWINSTNLFDAASGFGGYRESGFGREGGNEGMYEYLVPSWEGFLPVYEKSEVALRPYPLTNSANANRIEPLIDRSPKLYIGGKQTRSDSGYSFTLEDAEGHYISETGLGNRKDVRNAVQAAGKAESWARATAHLRAQILYYLGENLSVRAAEFSRRLSSLTGATQNETQFEVQKTIQRLFYYAAWADKYDGHVHQTPFRNVTLAMPEPWGIVGVVCPAEQPLLALVSLVAPLIATGNRVVAVPSWKFPLLATDFYQILDTSDVPAGVINLVTGHPDELAKVLAQHDDVDALWYVGSAKISGSVERESAGNLKSTWVNHGKRRNWFDDHQAQGWEYLRHAVQIKNIWVPYGE